MTDPSQDEVGARYGVPKVTGNDAVSACRAWFTDKVEACAYAIALGGEVWDLVEGRRLTDLDPGEIRAMTEVQALVEDVASAVADGNGLKHELAVAAAAAVDEAYAAATKWPPFNSAHEGYAVLAEEVDELWDEVKVNQKRRDPAKMRAEGIQVAAMALRFVVDICGDDAAIRK